MKLNFFFALVIFSLIFTKTSSYETIILSLDKKSLVEKKNLIINADSIDILFDKTCEIKEEKVQFRRTQKSIFKEINILDQNKYLYYLKKLFNDNSDIELILLKSKKKDIPLLINNKDINLIRISYLNNYERKNNIEFHVNARKTNNLIEFLNYKIKDFATVEFNNRTHFYFISNPNDINYLHFNFVIETDDIEISHIKFSKLLSPINEIAYVPELLSFSSKQSASINSWPGRMRISFLQNLAQVCPDSRFSLTFR